jgi:hypothetical protein
MAELFNRDLKVNVGGVEIAIRPDDIDQPRPTLRTTFKIDRNLGTEPNRAEISIYNLRKENRAKLREGKKKRLVVEAGYVGFTHVIFDGDVEFVQSVNDGTNWVTNLQSGDGSRQYRAARINLSFKGGVKVEEVFKELGNATGLKIGNLLEKAGGARLQEKFDEFKNGKALSGSVQKILKDLGKSAGLEFSTQNGEMQFLEPKELLDLPFVLLKAGTGLVGSPEAGEDGVVNARSLLQPKLMPGRGVEIDAREVKGFFKATKVLFVGDTMGNDWFADVECKPL